MFLRKPTVNDYLKLYEMVVEPTVIKYVRYKPVSLDHYLYMMEDLIIMEDLGECISRTIIVNNEPVGVITLFDIEDNSGFLATWIGVEHQGKGYNQKAKELFFKECYESLNVQNIYMKIRTENIKSQRAATKIQYVEKACPYNHEDVYNKVNIMEYIFDVFLVNKRKFLESLRNEDDECFLRNYILNPLYKINEKILTKKIITV